MWKYATKLLAIAAFFLYSSYTWFDDDPKTQVLIRMLVQSLNQAHFDPKKIDDDFSEKVFHQYLKKLDYQKRFLLQPDIDNLVKYAKLLDDEMNYGTLQFFDMSFDLVGQRIGEAQVYYQERISEPFDFTKKESIDLDFEEIPYAQTKDELREYWRKFIKYQVLTQLSALHQTNADRSPEERKGDKELEEQARRKVEKLFDDWFKRLSKIEKRDRLSDYFNAITNIHDPHTVYYAPKAKEDFDIEFSGKLEGIGARLSDRDGYITVAHIVPGSASWRQGDLEVEDKILKVGQGEEDPVDIVGMRIDDAVQLIRGKKGTEVRLTVKKLDGSDREISIIRDVVIFEESYAKSAIMEFQNKIGYIKLPAFYADFSETNGRRCAVDVKQEIIKMKGEGIEGLVLDLRDNGGGSLADVVEMAGLFIDKGPIVQVKSREGNPMVLEDTDPEIYYEGPLVIMVNSFSASASEIMAAAMQDYKRAVIIGSGSATFGKGTVQRIINFDEVLPSSYDNIKPLGSIMMTTQKFYRIDGTTNQLKGVEPDISLPDRYNYIDHGEKNLEFPIPWDEISAADYLQWDKLSSMDDIVDLSLLRVQNSHSFQLVDDNALRLKDQREKTNLTLNLASYMEEQKFRKEEVKKYQETGADFPELAIRSLEINLVEEQADSSKWASIQVMHRNLKKDIYLHEAISVLDDIKQTELVSCQL